MSYLYLSLLALPPPDYSHPASHKSSEFVRGSGVVGLRQAPGSAWPPRLCGRAKAFDKSCSESILILSDNTRVCPGIWRASGNLVNQLGRTLINHRRMELSRSFEPGTATVATATTSGSLDAELQARQFS
jgi:hypothetical protein